MKPYPIREFSCHLQYNNNKKWVFIGTVHSKTYKDAYMWLIGIMRSYEGSTDCKVSLYRKASRSS